MGDGLSDAARMEDDARLVEETEAKNDEFNKFLAVDVFGWLERHLHEYRYKRWSLLFFLGRKDPGDDESAAQDRRALEEMRPRLIKRLRDLADKLEKKF